MEGKSVYGSRSREQELAEGRERYRRPIYRMKAKGTYSHYAIANRSRCQSYGERVKQMKVDSPHVPFGECISEWGLKHPLFCLRSV